MTVAIFGYRALSPGEFQSASLSFWRARLAEQLVGLAEVGVSFVSSEDVFFPGYAASFAFEGDLFALEVAAPLLAAARVPAVVLVAPDRVGGSGYLSREGLKELLKAGFSIGVYEPTEAARGAREALEDFLQSPVRIAGVSAEKIAYSARAAAALAGYRYLLTTRPGLVRASSDPMHLPRFMVDARTSPQHLIRLARGALLPRLALWGQSTVGRLRAPRARASRGALPEQHGFREASG